MSALTNAAENALLLLLFNNTTWANIGDATGIVGSTVPGNFRISLHTADPTETGNQTSSEISYTGYARVSLARSGAAWTVTGNSVSPTANVDFGAMTAGAGGTVTFIGIGTDVSGAGNLILRLAVSPTIAVTTGVTPRITTATALTAE
jgi:hypothetical protein